MPLNHIYPLPVWLNLRIVDSVIYLWGVPSINDEYEI